jgi:flagellum-specific peptidoglycan hydrolase FlgJ
MYRNSKLILAILVIAVTIASCGSNKKVVTRKKKPAPTTKPAPAKPKPVVQTLPKEKDKVTEIIKTRGADKTADYVEDFAKVAMAEMKLYKIPASITLAQGILESGSGYGRLAAEANNHFGIKCHKGWTGGEIYHDDDALQECFRTYKDASYSYRDHSLFLKDRKRYSGLFDLDKDDYVGWAHGLRRAGYATDPKYPEKLISLIERYELYKYDAQVLGKAPERKPTNTETVAHVPGITHEVIKGDTLYNISKRYNLTVDELKNYNRLTGNEISLGQVLFIKKQ